MVRKNDIIDLTIEDLGVNGEGIAKLMAILSLSKMG